jgi:hypothetical protein
LSPFFVYDLMTEFCGQLENDEMCYEASDIIAIAFLGRYQLWVPKKYLSMGFIRGYQKHFVIVARKQYPSTGDTAMEWLWCDQLQQMGLGIKNQKDHIKFGNCMASSTVKPPSYKGLVERQAGKPNA